MPAGGLPKRQVPPRQRTSVYKFTGLAEP
jgi:hypothetical protein